MASDLTEKQRRFVAAYVGEAQGNATEAARLAGYVGAPDSLKVTGSRLLTRANVKAEVTRLSQKAERATIADVIECKEILSALLRNEAIEPKDRISAGDKLLKTHGAYLERREVEHKGAAVSFIFDDNGRGPKP